MPTRPASLRRPGTVLGTALALAATAAHAADPNTRDAETRLPTVTVEAAAPPSGPVGPDNGYQAQRSATATKTDAPLAETAQSISVVTRQRIEDQGARSVQEAINYVAGVRTGGLDSRTDATRIRGSRPTEYLDGLRRQISGTYSSTSRVEPYLLERIEVLRGPASTLYGQGTTGGLLNMISKRPLPETRREFGIEFGSFDTRQVQTDLTGALSDDGVWMYRLVGLARDAGTQVDHVDDDRVVVAPSLTWEPGPDTSLTFQGLYQRDRSGSTSQSLPWEGTVNTGPNGRIPTGRFIGDPDNDRYDSDRNEAAVLFTHRFNPDTTLRHVTRYSDNEVELVTLYANTFSNPFNPYLDPQRRVVGRFASDIKRRSRVFGSDTSVEKVLRTGSVEHQVLLGFEYGRHREDSASVFPAVAPIDVYDPVYVPYTQSPRITRPVSWLTQGGVYAQNRMTWGPWIAAAGIRRDRVENELQRAQVQRDFSTSHSASLMYRFDMGLAPYVAYNESFTPVGGTNFFGERFNPLEGEQVEIGFKFQPPGTDWAFNAAFYELEELNQLIPDPDNPFNRVQTGEIHNRGIELELIGRLFDRVDLAAHYNYIDPDPAIEHLPHHQGAVWGSVPFSVGRVKGFRAGLGVRYFSAYREGFAPTTPAVTLFDGMLTYDRGPWRYALHGQNLADDTYVAHCSRGPFGECLYGARRSVYATVSYRYE